jgi:hypothetical protein
MLASLVQNMNFLDILEDELIPLDKRNLQGKIQNKDLSSTQSYHHMILQDKDVAFPPHNNFHRDISLDEFDAALHHHQIHLLLSCNILLRHSGEELIDQDKICQQNHKGLVWHLYLAPQIQLDSSILFGKADIHPQS